jgi:tetratricopeptide (TPR) repeat protein
MADLESLLKELAQCDAKRDVIGLRRVREHIIAEHALSDAAVEAIYKIGLDLLFRERNLDAAVEQFLAATKRKHPYWSQAARTSLGLCYYHQKRTQKALLELRKVAMVEVPNLHSVAALAFLENIFETEGESKEAQKIRKERVSQLTRLAKESRDGKHAQDLGYYLYQLALAHKDSGDDNNAKQCLREAHALGRKVLGDELFRSVDEALKWR